MLHRTLRFDGLPTFESTPNFFSLPAEVESRLAALPNVHARANTALRFNNMVGAGADFLHVRDDELQRMYAAYLRAALMDFVGMEDVLRVDLRSSGIARPPLRISDTLNAMLIVLRELRNIQVHSVVPLLKQERIAYLTRTQEHAVTLDAQMLPDAELTRLRRSRNAEKYFTRASYGLAVDWLAEAQAHWGIADVVIQAIWTYSRLLADHYVNELAA